ncbi:MAG TPA: hypothetical protein VHE35_00760 [Kofleriaceae bacterium]|nr:hypothetical protein [Kofleriaceae bacterium]
MKTKLALAFTLLSSLAFAGAAAADSFHVGFGAAAVTDTVRVGFDAHVTIGDRRTPAPAPVVLPAPLPAPVIVPPMLPQPAPVFVPPMLPQPAPVMIQQPIYQPAAYQPAAYQPGSIAARWDLLATTAAGRGRGTFTVTLPAGSSYDQLRLIAPARGVDLQAVRLTYARGRTEVVRANADGIVDLDVGHGRLRSITVTYTARGFGRGAGNIQVMGLDTGARGGFHR